MLFVWGRNSDGQCGTDLPASKLRGCVALPRPIKLPKPVISVACGTGQQGCTLAVTEDGALYTFGNDAGGRLGHPRIGSERRGTSNTNPTPRRVEALAGVKVVQACCSDQHALCVTDEGAMYSWGQQGRTGCLGRPEVAPNDQALPAVVALSAAARFADCESGVSAAVLVDGSLSAWGSNEYGRLGLGRSRLNEIVPTPTAVSLPEGCGSLTALALGSLYGACICQGGDSSTTAEDGAGSLLLTWGYGGHGNLGHGDRHDQPSPKRVEGGAGSPFAAEGAFSAVACTRGQEGVKGGLYPKAGGSEGPHTMVVGSSGALYTFGTCHKGLLANLGAKTGGFGDNFDELTPYCVGSTLPRNATMPAADPISPFACWPPQRYSLEPGPLVAVASGHIHASALGADGRLWAWGCGSNDGRCGVERFLNMAGEGKPPHVDSMKCYMMGPHRVGIARSTYWPHSPSLDGVRVTAIATGRNHMAAIGLVGEGPPAAIVHGHFQQDGARPPAHIPFAITRAHRPQKQRADDDGGV